MNDDNNNNKINNLSKFHIKSRNQGYSAIISNLSTCFLYPFELFKIRMQINNTKIKFLTFSYDIFKEEGIRGLYRGFSWTILSGSVSNFLFFYQLQMLNLLTDNIITLEYSIKKQAFNSYFSGLISSIISLPFWTIRTRICQISYNKKEKLIEGSKLTLLVIKDSISSNKKLKSLFRGIVPTFFLSAYPAIQMTVYQQIKNKFKLNNNFSSFVKWASFLAGSLSQIVTSFVMFPLNLIKAKQQQLSKVNNYDLNNKLYRNNFNENKYLTFLSTAKNVYSDNGIRGYFKGFTPLLIRNIFKGGIFFYFFEISNSKINKYTN